ncbi:MAG TPA: HPF/RaiA family ribosome-associated protein [Gemmataceae bacterium]|nr:HPF/RaiA family ribosome-associated protein [Gemmataceae bacterium]
MQLPLQISFRHMAPSEEIERLVRQKAAKLDNFSNQIMSCRVVIEPKGKHHQHGNQYDVRVTLTVPGEELAATRTPSEDTEHRDIRISLRDAFESAGRLLQDYERRKRRDVKSLDAMPHGKVSRLMPEEGYGFVRTLDGREIYFHRSSVLQDGFARLEVGTEVAFAEEAGRDGPQASTVKIAGRHGGSGEW